MHSEPHNIRDGLRGELCRARPTKQLIVVCNGYKTSTAHPATVTITRALNLKGYATFTFNFSGKNPADLIQQVADINDIVAYFKPNYPDIVLLAGSLGALSAVIVAGHEKIKRLITVNGFFGSEQLGRKPKTIFLVFKVLRFVSLRYKKIWDFYQREFRPERITAPTLVIHSPADEMVSIIQSRNFFAMVVGSKRFVELGPADHHLTSAESTSQVVEEVDAWLSSQA